MGTLRRFALLVPVLAAGAVRVSAQTCNTNRADAIGFTVTPASTAIATPGAAEFNAGASQAASYTLSITPTKNWTWYLCIQAVSANWGTVNGYTKPISDLQWSLNGGAWTSITGALAQMTTGSGAATYTLQVRALLAWANDEPLASGAPATYGPVSFNVQVAH